jgi:glycosyltransferase 2 family protein
MQNTGHIADAAPAVAVPGNGAADTAIRGGLVERLRSPRTIASFIVAIVLVVVLFQRLNIDLAAVWRAITGANPAYVALAFAAYFLAFPVRAARWRALLVSADVADGATAPLPPVRTLTTIVLLSWFVNCIVPAKLGDAYRGLLLRQRIGVSFTRALGTIVAERLLDVVALAVLLIASGLLAFHGSVPAALRWWFVAGAGLALVGVMGLVTLMFFGAALERLLPARLQPHVERLREGIVGSFKRAQMPAVCGFTAAIWTLEGVRVYCVAHAFGVSLSAAQSTLVALLASLLTTFPITPAGLGAVEGGMIVALKLFDVSVTNAGAIALVDRGIAYWSVIVVGGAAWLVSRRQRVAALAANASIAPQPVGATGD